MAWSAEVMVNWMPRVLGSMMLRPGLAYLGSTRGDAQAKQIPFVFGEDDTALVELTAGRMRVRIDDTVVRRPAVTSSFYRWNGADWAVSADTSSLFGDATDVGYWKDADESGATSSFAVGGYLSLLGDGRASAIRDRKVDVVETGVEHSIAITVARGDVTLRIGSTEGGDEYLTDRTLRPGQHSISVAPAGDFFVRLSNYRDFASLVDSVMIGQAAVDMELVTPWAEADLPMIRWSQSGDVVFVACKGVPQKRIERQGASSPRSWSVVDYLPEDGPFGDLNTGPIRLKGSALTGDITLTAERAFFKPSHVGALFELTSAGQEVTRNLVAEDTWSDPIRVTGVGASARTFIISVAGTITTTTVRVQQSVAEPGNWTDVSGLTWTGVFGPSPHNDGLDNQIVYYRIGVKTGEFAGGDDIDVSLTYSAGAITGRVRVTGYTSATEVSASVLRALGKADQYTRDWREGDWSPRKGYPSAVSFSGGRLTWQGKSYNWESVSDQFDSFDDTVEGDSGPIRRTIGEGPVDTVHWSLDAANLLLGLQGSVKAVRSSSLDEVVTQAKYALKQVSSVGTAAIQAHMVDTSAVFVGRNSSRVYEIAQEQGALAFGPPNDLTSIVPEIGDPGFVRFAVQRSPDTRLHFVRSDGTVAVLVLDRLENVNCWLEIETDGVVEDVVVLPGPPGSPEEDRVYYTVKRTVGGQTRRCVERWALESQARGGADNRMADSHVAGTLAGTAVITGLGHLEGRIVCIWGNGRDLGTVAVSGGQAIAPEPITGPYCVGLPYEALWKSAKLMTMGEELPFGKAKRITKLTLVAADMHARGLRYGQDFSHMDDLPLVEEGATVEQDSIWASYDYDALALDGVYDENARLCLRAAAPRPVTVLAVAVE